jgi:hypothetical protein
MKERGGAMTLDEFVDLVDEMLQARVRYFQARRSHQPASLKESIALEHQVKLAIREFRAKRSVEEWKGGSS